MFRRAKNGLIGADRPLVSWRRFIVTVLPEIVVLR
jgi:hypothetical protein